MAEQVLLYRLGSHVQGFTDLARGGAFAHGVYLVADGAVGGVDLRETLNDWVGVNLAAKVQMGIAHRAQPPPQVAPSPPKRFLWGAVGR